MGDIEMWRAILTGTLSVITLLSLLVALVALLELREKDRRLKFWQDATERADERNREVVKQRLDAQSEARGWERKYRDRTDDLDAATLRLERIANIAQDLPEEDAG